MHETALVGLAVAGVLYARQQDGGTTTEQEDSPPTEPTEQQQEEPETNPVDSFEPVTADGEVGVSGNGVVYDDPETGEHNDEPEDDTNATFNDLGLSGSYASNYDPDTQDGSSAPSGGSIADAGTSQTWGDAGEQENDDLSQRAADSDMDADTKSAFDRLANYDDPSNL